MDSTNISISQEAPILNTWNAYKELTKPRLSLMSVLTALGGYWIMNPVVSFEVLMSLIIGTSFAAGGASALNQYLERDLDGLMERTRNRPLPREAISSRNALYFGLALSVMGISLLGIGINLSAAILTFLTVFLYVALYTPLKKHTPWCTHIGTIPGALPILVGASAATGSINLLGVILFGVLAVWQMPHFMAIAWLYRKDYTRAGMPMITVVDPSGHRAGREAIIFSLLLTLLSTAPWYLGLMSPLYGVIALFSSLWMLILSFKFMKNTTEVTARKLFIASIIYLPLYLAVAVIDRSCF